ncbi:MAG: hypothetical protein ACREJ5_00480 [Geminicoccaceae bacterium]
MARQTGPVLLDTNVIIECWRVGAWRALARGYRLETVEACEAETQTGFQRRRPEQQIDAALLRASFSAIHAVTEAERAQAVVREEQIRFLDGGEQALWAHALGRTDDWLLCGPDKASLRVGIRLGFRERLVSLEQLLLDAGYRARDLRIAYTRAWLDRTLAEIAL